MYISRDTAIGMDDIRWATGLGFGLVFGFTFRFGFTTADSLAGDDARSAVLGGHYYYHLVRTNRVGLLVQDAQATGVGTLGVITSLPLGEAALGCSCEGGGGCASGGVPLGPVPALS